MVIQHNSSEWQSINKITTTSVMLAIVLFTSAIHSVILFLRYAGTASVNDAGNAFGKEFSIRNITKILSKFVEKMGYLFTEILPACVDGHRLHVHYLRHVARPTPDVCHVFSSRAQKKCAVHSVHNVRNKKWHGFSLGQMLLCTVKQGIAHLPAPPQRVRLPCTLDMINYIVAQNTKIGATQSQVMMATGVYMGFFLCLRSSEYISKTIVPLIDTHQFRATVVQFVLHDACYTLVNSNQIRNYKYEDFKTVKFSMLHAKNIRNGFGVPIWFSTHDTERRPVPFVHLVFQWSQNAIRFDKDPFLSFRVQDRLMCLLYVDIQAAVKSSNRLQNFSE
jgi:hypothetical protein